MVCDPRSGVQPFPALPIHREPRGARVATAGHGGSLAAGFELSRSGSKPRDHRWTSLPATCMAAAPAKQSLFLIVEAAPPIEDAALR